MKHVSSFFNHDIIIMPVTNTQDISCYTISSTRLREVIHSLDRNKQIYIYIYIYIYTINSMIQYTTLYDMSVGLCLINHSLSGLSLKEPVNPCSVWIARSVEASVTISTIPIPKTYITVIISILTFARFSGKGRQSRH